MGRIAITILLALSAVPVASGRDFAIPLSQAEVDGAALRAAPGDRVVIAPGKRATLKLVNLHGSAKHPIVVINGPGLVDVTNATGNWAVSVRGCRYVRVTGTGDPNHPHGIRAGCTKDNGTMTFNIHGRSSDIEVDHVEVYDSGFAGFNVKDEPSADGSTNREKFTMYNISIHDCHVHHTAGEGMYIGHTFYDGFDRVRYRGRPALPHLIKGLRVYNNHVHDTGCEALQVGSAAEDVAIFNNRFERTGLSPFMKWQDNGVQLGKGVTGSFNNNTIIDAPANGLIVWGLGEVRIYNNVIANAGAWGVYVQNAEATDYLIAHNTVVNPNLGGIRLGNPKPKKIVIANNLVVKADRKPFIEKVYRAVPHTERGNIMVGDVELLVFADAAKHDYRLRATSRTLRTCDSPWSAGIRFDGNWDTMPRTGKVDAGAFQFDRPTHQRTRERHAAPPPFTIKKR